MSSYAASNGALLRWPEDTRLREDSIARHQRGEVEPARAAFEAAFLAPRQFAWACATTPRSWSPRHVLLALQAMAGTLDVPPWARRAWHYTGRADRPGQCQRWRGQVVGALAHTFCTRGT